ncbi:MAG: ABC transporter ATP-binding protein [Lachnospiraceae bacterium]|nr:ABC transporter ATP-binding protein [Lachnospiraceae bacterium]
MAVIEVNNLTKDYGHGRGVFNVSVQVEKGECFGFLGPNGAGKSTTIRHLMGFSKPQSGDTKIMGMDSTKHSAMLQNTVGYLPGEIAFPAGMTGVQFLKMMQKMRGVTDTSYLEKLLQRFELDPNMPLKQMSLGTRRKLAVVTAFMHDPDILILDEPTSGLDPIMQEIFIEYILEEKKRGKTIFLSSHIFHEVDAACDRIAIIRDGVIVSEFNPKILKKESDKIYRVTFEDKSQWKEFTSRPYQFVSVNEEKLRARVQLKNSEMNAFITDLASFHITDFTEFPFTLEDYFMQFYKEDKIFEGVK